MKKKYLTVFASLIFIDFTSAMEHQEIKPEDSKAHQPSSSLVSLNVGYPQITDETMGRLTSLAGLSLTSLVNLTRLDLSFKGMKNEDVKLLEWMTHLKYLNLGHNTLITNKGIEYLTVLRGLTGLNLEETDITNEGIEPLKVLTGLNSLSLGYNHNITSVKPLKDLRELNTLGLRNTGIVDKDLIDLKGFTKLIYLSLRENNITNEGLPHLKVLVGLITLDLGYTKVTDGELLKDLRKFTYLRELMFANKYELNQEKPLKKR